MTVLWTLAAMESAGTRSTTMNASVSKAGMGRTVVTVCITCAEKFYFINTITRVTKYKNASIQSWITNQNFLLVYLYNQAPTWNVIATKVKPCPCDAVYILLHFLNIFSPERIQKINKSLNIGILQNYLLEKSSSVLLCPIKSTF